MTKLAPLLSCGNVSLEPFPDDAVGETYLKWLADPGVMGATEAGGIVYDVDTARAYVAKQNASEDVLFWRIMNSGRHIGNLRASGLSGPHRRATIALIIGESSEHGKGIGSRSISIAAEHLFGLGMRKITAGMYASNGASHRAFLKAGFVSEARLKAHFIHGDRVVDGILVARFNPTFQQEDRQDDNEF